MNWLNYIKDHGGSFPVPRIKRVSGLWKRPLKKGLIIG